MRGYLLANWTETGQQLPVPTVQPLLPYFKYPWTSDTYSETMQLCHTLRPRPNARRFASLFKHLPGLQLIYDDVLPQAEQIAVTHFGMTDGIEMDNWHLIRQFWEADGGSGFGGHQDERDGEPEKPLLLSAAIKLTADPEEADGTWMQLLMPSKEPVRYGAAAGSVVIFPSCSVHRSLRTPLNMGKVLKLVFFFKVKERLSAPEQPAQSKPAGSRPSRKRKGA